jgi:hypothetical protein
MRILDFEIEQTVPFLLDGLIDKRILIMMIFLHFKMVI